MAETAKRNKIKKKRFLCGTPHINCSGGVAKLSHSINHTMKSPKSHSTPQEAFSCYATYLQDILGYKQVGNREFEAPDGGPIRVLTKKSKFGAMLRGGKEERYVPKRSLNGVLIST